MARERWEDVIAYYRTYISIIQPLLQETRREIINLTPEDIINTEILKEILKKEIKRSVSKVKAISEFNAFFRKEIFNYIIGYIEEVKEDFPPLDIRDYIIDFLEEAISAFDLLLDIVKEDQSQQHDSTLFKLL